MLNSWETKFRNSKVKDWQPNAHHIVPEHFRKPNAKQEYKTLINKLDEIWGEGGFNINDGEINGVWLPRKMHIGNHSGETYYDQVFKRLKKITDNQNISDAQKKALIKNDIKAMRTEILTGRGKNGKLKLNKNWNTSNNPEVEEYFTEMERSIKYYNN